MICKSAICHCGRCGTQGWGDREKFLVKLAEKEAEKQKRMAQAPKTQTGGYKS